MHHFCQYQTDSDNLLNTITFVIIFFLIKLTDMFCGNDTSSTEESTTEFAYIFPFCCWIARGHCVLQCIHQQNRWTCIKLQKIYIFVRSMFKVSIYMYAYIVYPIELGFKL